MPNKRVKVFAANWKMNKTRDEALDFIYKVNTQVNLNNEYDCVIFSPSIYLKTLVKRQENIRIGAQNMHYLENGAYTGEISAPMLTNIGVSYILIGHSERREYFNEKDGDVNLKIKKALEHNLIPVVCVGEDSKIFDSGKTKSHLEKQIKIALMGIKEDDIPKIIIAYEPIWAIGTGKVAEPSKANETILEIRNCIKDIYSQKESNQIRILYGGSVKSSNLKDFLEQPEIDGVLVGGASLDADSYLNMAKCF